MDMLIPLLASFGPETVENWLLAGGYAVLFGLLVACGLGLPLPEDVPLIASGILIANGKMEWVPVAVLAWSGIIGGDLVLYHIGRKFGPNITKVPVIGRHISAQRLAKLEGWFERYGIWVVAIGRLFAGVRGAMVVTAGTIRYNRVKFLIADGLAAIVSGGLFILLGFWLGQNLPELMKLVNAGKGMALAVLAVLVTVGAIWWWRCHQRQRKSLPSAVDITLPDSPGLESRSPE